MTTRPVPASATSHAIVTPTGLRCLSADRTSTETTPYAPTISAARAAANRRRATTPVPDWTVGPASPRGPTGTAPTAACGALIAPPAELTGRQRRPWAFAAGRRSPDSPQWTPPQTFPGKAIADVTAG